MSVRQTGAGEGVVINVLHSMSAKRVGVIERTVLNALLRSRAGLLPVTFWKRYQIPSGVLASAVQRLVDQELVAYDAIRLRLTQKGYLAMVSGPDVAIEVRDMHWKDCPELFRAVAVQIGEPITPVLRLVDHSLLPEKYRQMNDILKL